MIDFTSMYNHLKFRVYYREMYYQLLYRIRFSIHYLISDKRKNKIVVKNYLVDRRKEIVIQ